MRGRVMALYAVAFLGSTPIGAPIVGAVAQAWGARAALALGGVATLLVAAATAKPALAPSAPDRPSDAERQQRHHGGGHDDDGRHTEAAEDGRQADDGERSEEELGRVANEELPPEPAEGRDGSSDGHGTEAGSPDGGASVAGRRPRRSAATSEKVTAP